MADGNAETTSAAQKQVTGENQSWIASVMASIGAAIIGLFAALFTRRRKEQADATRSTTSDDQLFDEVEKLKSDWQDDKKK